MDIEIATKEHVETCRGIVKAIHDGHSFLSLEAQWLIRHLIASGVRLADEYDFEEILDSKTEVHDAIMFFLTLREVCDAK